MTETPQPFSNQGTLIGKTLGDYELQELLTSGGMARIYKGFDLRLQRYAAVKVLMRELLDSDDTLTERFLREARAIARLDHTGIVPVFQSGEQDGYYFMAMRLIEGNDLADEVTNLRRLGQQLPPERAIHILEQVADALDYAHSEGIVHRDIKPSNILLTKGDRAYLTDFGLALWQSVDKTMGTAFGTPRYIAPEQALASEKAVPQSDVYALAVILYEILTGDMLFRADTPMQIALSHISDMPTPPRTINPLIPQRVEDEVLRALSKDPNLRHETAGEFIQAVKTAYADASTSTTPPMISTPTKKNTISTPPPNVPPPVPPKYTITPFKGVSIPRPKTETQTMSKVAPELREALESEQRASNRRSAVIGGGIVAGLVLLVAVVALLAGMTGVNAEQSTATAVAALEILSEQTRAVETEIAAATGSAAPTSTLTPTDEPTATHTSTDEPTVTPTFTDEPTATHTATDEPTATHTATDVPTNTPTATRTLRPTNTPTNTATSTHTPLASTNTPRPTNTTGPTQPPVVVPTQPTIEGSVEVLLTYDTDYLILRLNATGTRAADVRGLGGQGTSGTASAVANTITRLEQARCLVLHRQARQFTYTGECGRDTTNTVSLANNAVFWTGAADTTFDLTLNGEILVTCSSVPRAQTQTCTANFPPAE